MRRKWFRYRWAAIVLGLLVGAAAGFAVYWGSQLTGQSLFILCGGTAGGVAAVVIHGYARAVQLTEISVTLPHFSKLQFAVTPDNKHVAWRLFVESVTRISVQPLDEGTGLLREAMNSLYTLFTTTREILAQTQPSRRTGRSPTVEHLAVAMLNNEIRPFLAKWHPRLHAWEREHSTQSETEWPEGIECRRELAAMQQTLVRYAVGFGELAGVAQVDEIMWGILDPSSAERRPTLGHRGPAGKNST